MPACDLIFEADVASAIGVSIEASQEIAANSDGTNWLSNCVYWRHLYFDQAPVDVTLAAGDEYVAKFQELKTLPGTSSKSGLGDEAFLRMSTLAGLDGPIGALFIRFGNAVLSVALGVVDVTEDGGLVLAGDAARQEQILDELAALAIGRLTQPPPVATDTCALLSLAEVGQLLGSTLTAATNVDEHGTWDPACHYFGSDSIGSGNYIDLFLSVQHGAAGLANFDACGANAEPQLGVGEQALWAGNGQCVIRVGSFDFFSTLLLVRSGDTLMTVSARQDGRLDSDQLRAVDVAIARHVLQRLGLDPGSTPPPLAVDALAQPCSLLSDAEVATAVRIGIATHYERAAVDGLGATCYYALADSNLFPLHFELGSGQIAVGQFSDYKASGGHTAVDGIGDDAVQTQSQTDSDQPLVSLYVLTGQTVLKLYLGGNGQSTETFKVIAPGTPAEQVDILRGIAELILPRLAAGGQ